MNKITTEIKETLRAAFPLVSTNLIFACTGFVCTMMIAHLGKDYLAASVIVSTLWMALSFSFCGVLFSINILISHAYGANSKKEVGVITRHGFLLGLILCCILVFIVKKFSFVLQLAIDSPTVFEIASDYLNAQLWSLPGLIILTVYDQLLIGIGESKLILKISLFVVPLEIISAYIFIHGLFGLPSYNLAGIGYGLALTFNITALGMSLHLYYASTIKDYHVFIFEKFRFSYLKELAFLGVPIGIMQAIEIGALSVSALLIAKFGATMLAAHQIFIQYFWVAITFITAMSQAITMRVGHVVGKRESTDLFYAIIIGILISIFFTLILVFLFEFLNDFLLKIDINMNDSENFSLISHSKQLFRFASILLFFESIRISGFGCLRGLKDTKYPMLISFYCFWIIGLIGAYIIGYYYDLELLGVWMGLGAGMLFAALATVIRIKSKCLAIAVMHYLN